MTTLQNLTVAQLQEAISIKAKIENLQGQLRMVVGDEDHGGDNPSRARKMSAAARARIAAAQRARWAKEKRVKRVVLPKKRRRFSAGARAKMAAAARARWAKAKAQGENSL